MAKETNPCSFVLRVDAATMDALEAWAEDEFRSINGQLQWIITDALRRLLDEEGYTDTEVREDLYGKPRMTCSRRK